MLSNLLIQHHLYGVVLLSVSVRLTVSVRLLKLFLTSNGSTTINLGQYGDSDSMISKCFKQRLAYAYRPRSG